MKKLGLTLVLILTSWTLLNTTIGAGPIGPAEKLPNVPASEPVSSSTAGKWYLRNGAFDGLWEGDMPQAWQVYRGDADAYGSLDFLSPDGSGPVIDNAFVFQIVNNEVKGNHNAYLYQEITLPSGDYWLSVSSTVYGYGTGIRDTAGDQALAYNYMTYYALVPRTSAMTNGSFTPAQVPAQAWKELWPWSNVCSEQLKGWGVNDKWSDCDYVKRAETVSVTGGDYVFILRAQLKWPDWRAYAYYIFDDIQVIDATPRANNWSACVTSYCLEGLVKR